MPDYNPTLLRRVLMLRQVPLLAAADLDELATVAENMIESRLPAGASVARAGKRVTSVHLIIEGRIEGNGHAWGPRQLFGALEVLAGRDAAADAIAATDTRTLELPARDVAELLEDNFGLLIATLRDLAARMIRIAPPTSRLPGFSSDALGLVERVIMFRKQLPFVGACLDALTALAHTSEEVRWPVGTVVARAGERASDGLIIVEGSLRTSRGEELFSGASLGHLETLANLHHIDTIETVSAVRALRSSGPAMLDVLEDHTDVGLAMIATFAAAMLDTPNHMN